MLRNVKQISRISAPVLRDRKGRPAHKALPDPWGLRGRLDRKVLRGRWGLRGHPDRKGFRGRRAPRYLQEKRVRAAH
jgi:hypothetical protein